MRKLSSKTLTTSGGEPLHNWRWRCAWVPLQARGHIADYRAQMQHHNKTRFPNTLLGFWRECGVEVATVVGAVAREVAMVGWAWTRFLE